MTREQAKTLVDQLLALDAPFNALAETIEALDGDERMALKRALGELMGLAYTELMVPALAQYPELDPDKGLIKAPRINEDAGWKILNVLDTEAGLFRAIVEQNIAHGYFRYCIERYFGPADEDEGHWPDGFWEVTSLSGLYDSISQTEKEALASLR